MYSLILGGRRLLSALIQFVCEVDGGKDAYIEVNIERSDFAACLRLCPALCFFYVSPRVEICWKQAGFFRAGTRGSIENKVLAVVLETMVKMRQSFPRQVVRVHCCAFWKLRGEIWSSRFTELVFYVATCRCRLGRVSDAGLLL